MGLEFAGKIAVVIKAGIDGDPGDGGIGLAELFARGIQADLGDIFDRGAAEELFEVAFELAHGQVGHASKVFDGDFQGIIVVDIFDDIGELGIGPQDGAGVFIIDEGAGDADDVSVFVDEGDFGNEIPHEDAVAVGYHLNFVDDGFTGAHDAFVLLDIDFRDGRREEIAVGFADDFPFVIAAEQDAEISFVDFHELAEAVFDKQVHFGEVIEEQGQRRRGAEIFEKLFLEV